MFWQNVLLTPVMMGLVFFGMQREPIDRGENSGRGDWNGIVFAGLGLAFVYAGLDHGDRLDWLIIGRVVGLLLAGGLLLVAFVVTELVAEHPLIDLTIAAKPMSGSRR